MASTIETLGRKKLSVILIAILVVAAAWAGMILVSSWKARQQREAAEKALAENDLDQAAAGDLYGDGRIHFVTGTHSMNPDFVGSNALTIWENLGPRSSASSGK
ncbi:MAG TPA: hypothetical protein VGX70_17980 [Gemmataceae bacterium]|jgi:uncharacterized protein YpmB|nr:hypothetical protein [Gemmataceae bacterium]